MLEQVKEFTSNFMNSFSNITLNTSLIIFIAIIFIVLHNLRRFPIIKNISVFVSFFPVLVHEMGHAFVANILGGKVTDIHMVLSPKKQQETGQQGYAITGSKSKLSSILVVFSGYIAAPIMFYLGFYFVNQQLSFLYVGICLIFVIFYLSHTKQKWIPMILLIVVIYIGYAIFVETNPIILNSINSAYSIFLGLLLGEIVQSIIITTKITFSRSKQDWDGTNLEQLTHIPQHFWWLLWIIISLFVVFHVFKQIIIG